MNANAPFGYGMNLVGYADRMSVQPGCAIAFMVSSRASTFHAEVIRLIHGDTNPAGPGFKCEPLDSSVTGAYPGAPQSIRTGSYVLIPDDGSLHLDGSFTIHMWIRPTTPAKQSQTLISRVTPNGVDYALRLEQGRLSLQVGEDDETLVRLTKPIAIDTWYSVTAVHDAGTGQVSLSLDPREATASELGDATTRQVPRSRTLGPADVLIAAEMVSAGDDVVVGNHYNGKIDAPRLFDRALDNAELMALRRAGADEPHGLVAAWDFAADIGTSAVTDRSGHGRNGRTVNKPMRAATGWNWDGSETAWAQAPEQYGAIHFHDDDLDDAGWERSFIWTVPDDVPSGIYAVHLRADEDEDFVPFVVRPARGRPTANIAFVVPTFSYLAYANEHRLGEVTRDVLLSSGRSAAAAAGYPADPRDSYIVANRLNSLYDTHSDGSGVCYASRLRPLVNMRPKYDASWLASGEGSPHQFNADLHLVDWLDEGGYTVDVVTDDDLHDEGIELLEPYNVVITGTHHEYWSWAMIRATQRYLGQGGRLMYLAGNGMYWVTQPDPEHGNGIEVRRRGPATRTWEPEPGEAHLSATGELGGIWRFRGHAPQTWLGVGFTAQGAGDGRPYDRQPDSFDERASWIFEGIGDDEQIGAFPSLVNTYGAAGFEIDRADDNLGTPQRTMVIATASGFSDSYQHVSEEVLVSSSTQGGSVNALVRADMVLLEYPNGGAVFSPGSITWCACLSYNGYDNSVARVTKNVLDRFASRDR